MQSTLTTAGILCQKYSPKQIKKRNVRWFLSLLICQSTMEKKEYCAMRYANRPEPILCYADMEMYFHHLICKKSIGSRRKIWTSNTEWTKLNILCLLLFNVFGRLHFTQNNTCTVFMMYNQRLKAHLNEAIMCQHL